MFFEYTIYHTELEEIIRKGTIEAPNQAAVKGLILAQENGTSPTVRALEVQGVVKIYVRELTEV